MEFLTFDMIKMQLRLDDTQAQAEHDILCMYGESAEDTVMNTLNRTVEDLVEVYGHVPAPVKHAALMLTDVSYQHRSPVSPQNMSIVPYTYDLLLKPYMKLTT